MITIPRWFRQWRHRHGHHLLCREVDILDHVDMAREWITTVKPDGTLDFLDLTSQSGRPVYRKGHG